MITLNLVKNIIEAQKRNIGIVPEFTKNIEIYGVKIGLPYI